MLFSTVGQAYVFLITVALGGAMGLFHDVVRFLCAVTPSKITHWVVETIFWGLCVFLAFQVFMQANGGELRAYMVLGMGVGWCLYLISLSRLLGKIAQFALKGAGKLKKHPFIRQFLR